MKPQRNENGKFDAYAWPGGYPLFYLCDDGGTLCPACANRQNGSEADTSPDTPRDWRMVASDVHWEGEPLTCDHCGAKIESAYGIPDTY